LTRHYKKCKIKNGGTDILIDKLKHEQEMRELKDQIKDLTALVTKMLPFMKDAMGADAKQNTGDANGTHANQAGHNNIQNNQTIINNYDAPDLTDLKLSLEHIRQNEKIMLTLVKAIFLNPAKPENHSIILKNRKDKIWSVYENEWKLLCTADQREDLRRVVSNTAYKAGCDELNKLYDGEEGFKELRPSDQKRLYEFNGGETSEASLTEKEMTSVFIK
jgi:hypothetical protein